MQPRVVQVPTVVAEVHRVAGAEQPHDEVEALLHQPARVLLREPDHRAVRRQRARAGAEHDAPARQMVEQNDALRYPKRVVVREADNTGPEADVARSFGGDGDEDFRRGRQLGPRRVVLAAPGFVVATAVEPLDQFEVGLECQRGIDSWRMKRRQENAEAKALVHQRLSPLAWAAAENSG
jgi:hypothetical protein